MDGHGVYGECKAQDGGKSSVYTFLLLAWDECHLARVHDLTEIAHDRNERADQGDRRSDLEFRLNVAEAVAFPLTGNVVVWPDDCVEEVEEVCHDQPSNQAACSNVLALEMPDHGRNVQQKRETGEDDESDGLWIDCRSRRHHVSHILVIHGDERADLPVNII